MAVAASSTQGSVMTSLDGVKWTTQTKGTHLAGWSSIAYDSWEGGGGFVVVANSGNGRVMTSEDDISWTKRSSPASKWYSVANGNGQFVAVAYEAGWGESTTDIMTRPDGVVWASDSAYCSMVVGAGTHTSM